MEQIINDLQKALSNLQKEYDNKMKNGEDTELVSYAMQNIEEGIANLKDIY